MKVSNLRRTNLVTGRCAFQGGPKGGKSGYQLMGGGAKVKTTSLDKRVSGKKRGGKKETASFFPRGLYKNQRTRIPSHSRRGSQRKKNRQIDLFYHTKTEGEI